MILWLFKNIFVTLFLNLSEMSGLIHPNASSFNCVWRVCGCSCIFSPEAFNLLICASSYCCIMCLGSELSKQWMKWCIRLSLMDHH